MMQELEKQLSDLNIDKPLFTVIVNITGVTTTDPETIEVHYQSIFPETDYIQNRVLIEIGGRSMNEPIENAQINSMISQVYPDAPFADKPFTIRAVSPKRTFIEKAFLLHEEFAKEAVEYDLWQLIVF